MFFMHVIAKSGESLEGFVARVFSILRISDYKRRETSNVALGYYFRGSALGVLIDAMESEDTSREFSFELVLKLERGRPQVADDSFLDRLADLIARILTVEGYEVFTDVPPGRVGATWLKWKIVDQRQPLRDGAIVLEED